MFNLLLRLSRFGRLVLTRKQVIESNCIGALLAAAVVCGLLAWRGSDLTTEAWSVLAIVFFAMVVPTKIAFHSPAGWPRWTSIAVAAGLTLVGLFAAACCFTYPRLEPFQQKKLYDLTGDVLNAFLYGSLAWMIGANWIMSVKVKR